ncbi:MAG: hypothetical protein ACTHM6_00405, partial [Tepidisphaeraceae bacterium]
LIRGLGEFQDRPHLNPQHLRQRDLSLGQLHVHRHLQLQNARQFRLGGGGRGLGIQYGHRAPATAGF